MKIVELREEAEFSNLRAEWGELLALSASGTIFLTWEWLSAWWAAYGTPGDLRILLARDDQNVLRGIAPMRRQTVRRYGQEYSALVFIGDGSNDSDYLDFIIAAGSEAPVMEAFCKHWDEELARGTLLQLNEIPESSPNLPLLRALGQQNGMVWSEADVPCSTVPLAANWQDYVGQLASRFRTKIRSVLRNIEARPELQFHFCDQPDQVDRLLPPLFELHGRRWAKDGKPGVFHWEQKRTFYRTLSPLLIESGQLRFSWLEWKGRILACQYGFVYGDCYFQLQEGYDPDCEHWNVGVALRAWTIQEFLKQGVREYDFMAGVGRHKSDWGSKIKLSKRVVTGRASARNVLFCRGPEWESKTRERVKKWMPDRLLAARQALKDRRRDGAGEQAAGAAAMGADDASSTPSSVPADGPWTRNVLASCYFHSPLPSLLPRFRDRYQLRVSPNGSFPKLSFTKRREPSVRILFFHRVNDDRDPFITSMSTATFEQEMKFLAKRHRVVSLREAARRLAEGGPAEPVVAITFDDGYKDNFTNALPILQRYGLPATIFLTTGGIDSRERLWFEELSLAAKKTTQTFVDLEIDIPRRIWMRTEAERVHGKNQIIALLRGLPDAERRHWLTDILARLGSSGDTEDTMLTWDQIRLMKQSAIDFGGHTVTHPFVSRLEPEQAVWEVSECKRRIEQEIQSPVEHFAYPNGREGDFEPWNKQVLREAGYQTAVSTLWGVNYPSTDPMELRRGQPWEENTAMFAAKLEWYQWGDT